MLLLSFGRERAVELENGLVRRDLGVDGRDDGGEDGFVVEGLL